MTGQRMLVAALVTAAIGNGLVAGVFFAFSSFVMPALARVTPAVGVHAMQSINITVQRSMFLAEFMVTTALSAILIVVPWRFGNGVFAWLAAAAGVISVVGSFGVTMWINVPLNNALAAVAADAPAAATLWTSYLRDWGVANAGRAVASCIASLLFTCAALAAIAADA